MSIQYFTAILHLSNYFLSFLHLMKRRSMTRDSITYWYCDMRCPYHAESKCWLKSKCRSTAPYNAPVALPEEVCVWFLNHVFTKARVDLASQLLTANPLQVTDIGSIWRVVCGCNPGRKASNKFCRKPNLNKNRLFIFWSRKGFLVMEEMFTISLRCPYVHIYSFSKHKGLGRTPNVQL